jgi:crotonobetaine/carnitine-CoA ligase
VLRARDLDGIEARLVDAFDYPVLEGQPGELILRSRDPWCFTSGYLGAPEATANSGRRRACQPFICKLAYD